MRLRASERHRSQPTRHGDNGRKVESVGAIEECAQEARALVESAWTRLDRLVPDTQYKVMFRAFGSYVLERHY